MIIHPFPRNSPYGKTFLFIINHFPQILESMIEGVITLVVNCHYLKLVLTQSQLVPNIFPELIPIQSIIMTK